MTFDHLVERLEVSLEPSFDEQSAHASAYVLARSGVLAMARDDTTYGV